MTGELDALGSSVERLHTLVAPLTDDEIVAAAYPSEWTIADVLSHLGSSAVIMMRRLDDGLAGRATADDFPQSVWDEWNAKSPRAQVDDGLAADRAYFDRLAALPVPDRDRFVLAMGPLSFDFLGTVALRVNENAVHTWDVEVALDPDAVVPAPLVDAMIDRLELIAGYTARPTGAAKTIVVRTTAPERFFTTTLTADAVAFASGGGAGTETVTLPAEGFVRIVYGRFDPGDDAALQELVAIFPGP